ncbi:hypothetical protein [Sinomonas cyclohexanicum]|nr:hypothetical protein [Corynebacterium cyclohexanicum]
MEVALLLVGNTRGLQPDPTDSVPDTGPGAVHVLRGVKREYSFTVEGPFEVEADDVPEEVAAAVPGARTMFQVLVEGTAVAEIPHAVRFARKLAKACFGAVLDEQTSEVWPQPKEPAPASEFRVYPRVDAVEFAWYCLADEMPQDLPRRYLRLAEAHLPEALPVRYGTYTPLQGNFARDGEEGFKSAWVQAVGSDLAMDTAPPVSWASLRPIREQRIGDVRDMRMTITREALEHASLRSRVKQFFIQFAIEIRAFHATAEVQRNYILENNRARILSGSSEMFRYSALQGDWVGLKPHPQWWMWFGPLYADAVRPYLTGHLEEYPEGVFHSWTDAPANRDELTTLLPDPARPWIPERFTPVYEDGVVQPVSTAEWMPQRLREAHVPPQPWTDDDSNA